MSKDKNLEDFFPNKKESYFKKFNIDHSFKFKLIEEEEIINCIKTVMDPEIPVNLYDLGLIYNIEVKNENEAYIEMTLTSPNCPVADSLPKMVKENINSIEEIKKVDLKLVWSPPWTKDMMSEEAKLELNL